MIVSRRSSQTLCSQSGRPPGVRRKAILLCLALAALPCPIHALDFAFRLMPDISLPVLDSADYYTLGGGAMVSADLELLGFLAPFVEAGFHAVPTKNTGKSLSLTAGGAGVGFFYYPIPRLKLRVAAGAGPYYGTYGTLQVSN